VGAQREPLTVERAAATARIEALTWDIDRLIAATTEANADDEHDPEGATIAFERAQAAALRGQAVERLAALDAALARLELSKYGDCENCGQPIGAERLDALPAARTCIACARRKR
jgi:RNA polymerase-binding transcription factor DksA